jgi:sarcosine oxidase
VVGLGATGSSVLYHLARRGQRVLGIDRFTPPHSRGSSHGETRIIREAYFEHPLYVPLVQHAYRRWHELEAEADQALLHPTGGLMLGAPDGELVAGARRSAVEHSLPFEELTATEIRGRFPAFTPHDGTVGLYEPRAGVLFPERCVETFLSVAERHGAEVRCDDPVVRWTATASSVEVHTATLTSRAGRLVLAGGAWMGSLVQDLGLPLAVERQAVHWLEPREPADTLSPDRCPVYLVEYEPGHLWYGFPRFERGVKVALHHDGRPTDPGVVAPVAPEEVERMQRLVDRMIPAANGRLLASATCVYTNTPDHHFVVDHHPDHRSVVVASPCSGHGFKFASALGGVIADIVTGDEPAFDLAPFRIDRFVR